MQFTLKSLKLRVKIIDSRVRVWYNNTVRNAVAKEGENMSTIKVGENESVESALRRFKRKCSRDGIIGDLRKKEFYESPSVKKRKKAEAARKRGRN